MERYIFPMRLDSIGNNLINILNNNITKRDMSLISMIIEPICFGNKKNKSLIKVSNIIVVV